MKRGFVSDCFGCGEAPPMPELSGFFTWFLRKYDSGGSFLQTMGEMKLKKIRSLILAGTILFGLAACDNALDPALVTDPAETEAFVLTGDAQLPRNETLYFAGQQWGSVNGWNIMGYDQNNAMAIAFSAGYRSVMFETLYMWDMLSGTMKGLLANDDWEWNEDMSKLTLTIKDAAMWSDGTPVTAEDVKRTWEVSYEIQNETGFTYGKYIDSIEAEGKRVTIHCRLDEHGVPVNPLKVKDFLVLAPIAQAAWIDKLYERCQGNARKILQDPGEDVVWSGPYCKFYADDQKVVLIRDDHYWGQDASMWGKLPVPKYLAHYIYEDNAAGEAALKAGEVDVYQQFIENVQDLWLEEDLPISTYYQDAPYMVGATMPTAWFNMNLPVLKENVDLRKAIAYAVDYDAIASLALKDQSASFTEVPRSLMNPTDGEQALYDREAVAALQWEGNDVVTAQKLLDSAGIVDSDGDGWREWKGEKITLNACCPNGWKDWQIALEIVAAAGEKIGIHIHTKYPDWTEYQTVFIDPDQEEYAIFLWSPDASSPSNPWSRVNQLMGKDFVGIDNNWSGNWGQYVNEEADSLIKKIPFTTDREELKLIYTRLTEIYLSEVPSFSLMYRPWVFCTVNESVWTNFPSAKDGRGIPPTACTDGYGIRGLYELKLAE